MKHVLPLSGPTRAEIPGGGRALLSTGTGARFTAILPSGEACPPQDLGIPRESAATSFLADNVKFTNQVWHA